MLDIEWFSKKILIVEVNSIGFDEIKQYLESEIYLGNWKNKKQVKAKSERKSKFGGFGALIISLTGSLFVTSPAVNNEYGNLCSVCV